MATATFLARGTLFAYIPGMSSSSSSESSNIHPQVEAAHVSARAATRSANLSFVAAIATAAIGVAATVIAKSSSDRAEASAKLVENAASFSKVPPGTVIAWAGDLTESNKKAMAELGWRVCDGDPTFDSKQHPEYERWVARVWNASNDKSSASRLPDLRGQFLRGTTAERQVADKQDDAVGHHKHFIAQVFAQTDKAKSFNKDEKTKNAPEADAVGEIAYYVEAYPNDTSGRNYALMRAPDRNDDSHPGYVGQTSGNIANDPLKFGGKRADVVDESSETRPANIAVHWLIYVGRPQTSTK